MLLPRYQPRKEQGRRRRI